MLCDEAGEIVLGVNGCLVFPKWPAWFCSMLFWENRISLATAKINPVRVLKWRFCFLAAKCQFYCVYRRECFVLRLWPDATGLAVAFASSMRPFAERVPVTSSCNTNYKHERILASRLRAARASAALARPLRPPPPAVRRSGSAAETGQSTARPTRDTGG